MVKSILLVSNIDPPNNLKDKFIMMGQWCLRASQKKKWEEHNYEVLNYHWNDRKKLQKDYFKLLDVYELFLVYLTGKLNKIHKTKHSKRYWRILIGPWLGYFIQIAYDRWFMLNYALNNYKVDEILFLKNNDDLTSCNDMNEFYKYLSLDNFNNLLCKEIFLQMDNEVINSIKIKEGNFFENQVKPDHKKKSSYSLKKIQVKNISSNKKKYK